MQVFKRVRFAQNLIEFVFILPLLLFMTLVIFETALFWQDVNSIYNLNAEVNANAALADTTNMQMGTRCTAATKAFNSFQKKDYAISLNKAVYNNSAGIDDASLVVDGTEPFALYRYSASPITVMAQEGTGLAHSSKAVTRPRVSLWVDCRSPFEKGVTTQIEFYHKILIMKATIPTFSGDAIVVIPDNVFIASPKLNTLRHF